MFCDYCDTEYLLSYSDADDPKHFCSTGCECDAEAEAEEEAFETYDDFAAEDEEEEEPEQ